MGLIGNIRFSMMLAAFYCSLMLYSQEVKLGLPIGHVEDITSASFSPDGKLIATNSADKTVKIWDVSTAKLIHSLEGHNKKVFASCFSPDASTIVSIEYGDTAKVWDVNTGELSFNLVGHRHQFSSVVFSPNGKFIATGSYDSTAKIWDAYTGELLVNLKGHSSYVNDLAFNHKGDRLVTASSDQTNKIWNVETGELLFTLLGHSRNVQGVAYSPDDTKIVSVGMDNAVKVWNTEDGSLIETLNGHNNWVNKVRFSPDGKSFLTSCSNHTLMVWNASTLELNYSIENDFHLWSSEFSPNGKYLVIGLNDNKAQIIDAATGKIIRELDKHKRGVRHAVFSPDSRSVLTVSMDKKGILWDAKSGRAIEVLDGHETHQFFAEFHPDNESIIVDSRSKNLKVINAVTGEVTQTLDVSSPYLSFLGHSRDSNYIITGIGNGRAKIFDASNNELLWVLEKHSDHLRTGTLSPNRQLILTRFTDTAFLYKVEDGSLVHKLVGHSKDIRCGSFSPDGKVIVTGAFTKMNVWETKTGKLIRSVEAHERPFRSVCFSPNGEHILTTAMDNTAKIWDAKSYSLLHVLEGHTRELTWGAYSVVGDKLATSSVDGTAKVWDANSAELIYSLDSHQYMINTVVFSPDGQLLASCDIKGKIIIWDLSNGELKHRLAGHRKDVVSLVFSADGQKLISSSRDLSAKIWEVKTGELIQTIERKGTSFTHEKSNSYGMKLNWNQFNFQIFVIDTINDVRLQTLKGHTDGIRSVEFSPDGNYVLSASTDKTARIWEISTGKELLKLEGHSQQLSHATYSPNGEYIITTSFDGSNILWDAKNGEQLLQHYVFDDDPHKWVHIHPSGLFDASPEAMKMMYWTKGKEIIEFNQLKQSYWVPGLWLKCMLKEELPNVKDIHKLELAPEVILGEVQDGKVPITLKSRGGGVGNVSVFLNGKELTQSAGGSEIDSAKSEQTIFYSIANNPSLLNGENTVSVQASTADGTINSRGVQVDVLEEKDSVEPTFFGVVIGVSTYENSAINLKYPVSDAKAVSYSIRKAAENLYGVDKARVYSLSDADSLHPTKQNIEYVFREIQSKAKAEDVIFIYLSGHGITWGDASFSDFYFLTSEASSIHKDSYNDSNLRRSSTVSTSEMVAWLNKIPSTRQVMIIDACGAGQALVNIRDNKYVYQSQVKAIDRMKDRTGMYVLSGCAADAVSFESSQFAQGLLTYTILEAMSGGAIRQQKYVDVLKVMSHAQQRVPELAKGLGGIQEPLILLPSIGTFDIGILEKEDQASIPLSQPKPVYIQSILVNKKLYRDTDGLSSLMDKALLNESNLPSSSITFYDLNTYSKSCQITGGYLITETGVEADITISCSGEDQLYQIKAGSNEELVEKILAFIKS